MRLSGPKIPSDSHLIKKDASYNDTPWKGRKPVYRCAVRVSRNEALAHPQALLKQSTGFDPASCENLLREIRLRNFASSCECGGHLYTSSSLVFRLAACFDCLNGFKFPWGC